MFSLTFSETDINMLGQAINQYQASLNSLVSSVQAQLTSQLPTRELKEQSDDSN